MEHGNIEVYYTEGATKAEADRLGAYLVKLWSSGGSDRRSVQLKKAGEGYQFRMVVRVKQLSEISRNRPAVRCRTHLA